MGFAKAFVLVQLSLLLVSTSTVFSEDLDTDALPPHHPAMAPSHPPSHHHHNHHHSHSPSPAPLHPPSHPPIHPPSHNHHHGHPPSHAPVHPPMPHLPPHPPSHAPVHPPMHPHPHPHPPFHFPRSFVAVQGVVYCKSCKYAGVNDTLLGASPILGATVKLQCNNTKYPLVVQGKTDKNGYFFITAPKTITNYGAHKCKVSLVSSPLSSCSQPSDLHCGLKGATLRPEKPFMSNKLPFVLYTVGPLAFDPKCPL